MANKGSRLTWGAIGVLVLTLLLIETQQQRAEVIPAVGQSKLDTPRITAFTMTVPPSVNAASLLSLIDHPKRLLINADDVTKQTFKLKYIVPPTATGTVHLITDNRATELQAAKIEAIAGTATEREITITADTLKSIGDNGPRKLYLFWDDGKDASLISAAVDLAIDTRGPRLDREPELNGLPDGPSTLVLTFADRDLKRIDGLDVQKTVFSVQAIDAQGKAEATNHVSQVYFDPSGNVVKLQLPRLVTGTHQLTVSASTVAASTGVTARNPLTDFAGNLVNDGQDLIIPFMSYPAPAHGERIEFPEFAPMKAQQDTEFNPSARIETRVVRLYYFRDAHRVAELINRTVRSYNRAAVDQAERLAQKARVDADVLTDDRRHKERQAVQAAEQTRQLENQIRDATNQLSALTSLQAKFAVPTPAPSASPTGTASGTPPTPTTTFNSDEVAKVQAQITQVQNSIAQMQSQIAQLRNNEAVTNEAALQVQATEERAREEQFRLEVAAAHEDPDTYAPAKLDSVDPVAQCSVSVIGEGLIQLRGPIKGINKIRTAIVNQIDSPLGQVKVQIHTLQINGEKARYLERAMGKMESHVDLSRFLVNESLGLLRRAVQMEAQAVAEECAAACPPLDAQIVNDEGVVVQGPPPGHFQVDRDRKYLYAFYGRDFIDELYAMDSEFLHTENKILSLHSMDTISLHRALFTLALAKNDIRQRILARFAEMVKTELPAAEFQYREATELRPDKTHWWLPRFEREKTHARIQEAVYRNAEHRYQFRNFFGFFETGLGTPNTLNPTQREFIRLAQIFKSQMIAEVELKQRVVERGLIQDRAFQDLEIEARVSPQVRELAIQARNDSLKMQLSAAEDVGKAVFEAVKSAEMSRQAVLLGEEASAAAAASSKSMSALLDGLPDAKLTPAAVAERAGMQSKFRQSLAPLKESTFKLFKTLAGDPNYLKVLLQFTDNKTEADNITIAVSNVAKLESQLQNIQALLASGQDVYDDAFAWLLDVQPAADVILKAVTRHKAQYDAIIQALGALQQSLSLSAFDWQSAVANFNEINKLIPSEDKSLYAVVQQAYNAAVALNSVRLRQDQAEQFLHITRSPLNHKKLLDFLIDEQEEKYIELVDGTRAHIATVDNYLKRLSIALEDDFKVQFYDPAFIHIRHAGQSEHVTFGQIERTTVLTNNRAFAKVSPQATMEFDLPKRQIAVVEAMTGAKALVQDYGALLNDPTFLAAYQLMGGGKQGDMVKKPLPGLPSQPDSKPLTVPPDRPTVPTGSALQSLVPEPAVYQIETGTGFEIRPVIQPDGDSVIYNFNYMYSTNIREPVAADEKHLGRIRRHFIDTEVQTSSFELREISRYMVALKVARTSQGVPLLQDIPAVGALFRPAPSAESSLQQNVILGQTTVYPTLFDLMGLRWAPHVVDLNHVDLRDTAHVVRGRQQSITGHVFDRSSRQVDNFLEVQKLTPELHRPDLYRRQYIPSPYHPGGYNAPGQLQDPTGREFRIPDTRPPEYRSPPIDPRNRAPYSYEQILPEPSGPARQDPELDAQSLPPQSLPLNGPSGAASELVVPIAPAEALVPPIQPFRGDK